MSNTFSKLVRGMGKSELIPSERLVLHILSDHADERGACWPGLELLTTETDLGKRQLQKNLRRLEGLNLIKTDVSKNGLSPNLYWLNRKLLQHRYDIEQARRKRYWEELRGGHDKTSPNPFDADEPNPDQYQFTNHSSPPPPNGRTPPANVPTTHNNGIGMGYVWDTDASHDNGTDASHDAPLSPDTPLRSSWSSPKAPTEAPVRAPTEAPSYRGLFSKDPLHNGSINTPPIAPGVGGTHGHGEIDEVPNTCGWYLCDKPIPSHKQYCSKYHRKQSSQRRTNQRRAQEVVASYG